MPPSRRYLWFIPLFLVLAFGLYRSISASPSDFAGYYYGSRALIHHDYAGAYDMTQLNDRIAADGFRDVLVSYTPFPPFTSLVFAPFLAFSMPMSKILFNGVSVLFFLFSLFRIARYLSAPLYIPLVLPVIFFLPLLNNLLFGQSYLLLFALLSEGYLAYRNEKRMLASALWAIAILFKLFPAVIFLFLLLRRRYRDAAWLAVGCTLLLLASILANGTAAWHFYVFTILPRMNHGELNDSYTYVFQSAFMLLKKLFQYDQLLNPHPFTDNPWLFTLALAIFKSIPLMASILITRRERDNFFPFAAWMAAAMLISPNGSSYSLVLLILPFLGLIHRTSSRRPSDNPRPFSARSVSPLPIAGSLLLFAACTVPVSRFVGLPALAQFPRLYLLLLFFALLCYRRHAWNTALFITLASLFFLFDIRGNLPQKDTSSYLLAKESHLLTDGFAARDGHLICYWRDDKGHHEEQTAVPAYSLTTRDVSLRDNQIWYKGIQLTASPDQKAMPAILNGEYIIYLSDKHRGFEFYALRRIKLDAGPQDAGAVPGSSQ